jgi:glycosyltransferase involved in cell wall biosynthesis
VISVIVPVSRNEEPFLSQALESINVQTYRDTEIILETDPNGTGPAATRNRALARANGEYVAFCDADDYLAPDALERMVNAIGDADMVAGGFRKFGDFEMTVTHAGGLLTIGEVAAYAMRNLRNPREHQLLSGCWAKLYRWDLVGVFPEHLTTAEDMAFNFDCLSRCYRRVAIVPEVVYHNRKRQRSTTTTFDPSNRPALFGFLGGLRYVREFLEGFYGDHEIEEAIDNSKVYHSMLYAERIGPDALRKVFPLC